MKHTLYTLLLMCLLTACGGPQVPEQYAQSQATPLIYPDYEDVTVPINIAPLNFELLIQSDETVVRLSAADEEIVCEGSKIRIDLDDWKALTTKALGKAITVEVFIQTKDQWTRLKPFNIYVSPDSIDPWISYRLISPSYVSYEELTLNQRCLENFEEEVFADNMLCSTESGGQCINCHNFQQYNPDRMQFHARQTHGGTLIAVLLYFAKDWYTILKDAALPFFDKANKGKGIFSVLKENIQQKPDTAGMLWLLIIATIPAGVFGVLLAIASVAFRVQQDERIGLIRAALPGANCGGCGYPGCDGYASGVVNEGAATNRCSVGGAPVAQATPPPAP